MLGYFTTKYEYQALQHPCFRLSSCSYVFQHRCQQCSYTNTAVFQHRCYHAMFVALQRSSGYNLYRLLQSLNGVCTWIPKCVLYRTFTGSLLDFYTLCTQSVLVYSIFTPCVLDTYSHTMQAYVPGIPLRARTHYKHKLSLAKVMNYKAVFDSMFIFHQNVPFILQFVMKLLKHCAILPVRSLQFHYFIQRMCHLMTVVQA